MNIQTLIVGLLIAAAVLYVARSFYKSAQGKACESGGCGCDSKKVSSRQ